MFAKIERVSYAVRRIAKSPYAEEWHNKGIEWFLHMSNNREKGEYHMRYSWRNR